jgi:hypothetical protein
MLEDLADRAQRVAMAGYGHVTWVLPQPLFNLHNKWVCSLFNHLQAFSLWRWKVIASMHFSKPPGSFISHFYFTFALKQIIAPLDKVIIDENRYIRMSLKD